MKPFLHQWLLVVLFYPLIERKLRPSPMSYSWSWWQLWVTQNSCWEVNPGPPQDQEEFITPESCLQSPDNCFLWQDVILLWLAWNACSPCLHLPNAETYHASSQKCFCLLRWAILVALSVAVCLLVETGSCVGLEFTLRLRFWSEGDLSASASCARVAGMCRHMLSHLL